MVKRPADLHCYRPSFEGGRTVYQHVTARRSVKETAPRAEATIKWFVCAATVRALAFASCACVVVTSSARFKTPPDDGLNLLIQVAMECHDM